MIKTFHVRYHSPRSNFMTETEKPFEPEHCEEIFLQPVIYRDGLPETLALFLVNKWNEANGSLGFTYWIKGDQNDN